MMALDLSALDEKPVPFLSPDVTQTTGKPLNIPLVDIEEDPNQPRKEFSDRSMLEMTDSIIVRGVKTPVSVRPHPSKPGKWMLNYGARRFRGSCVAGRETIPAFIDEAHDHYDQVIENIQRDDLKAMELALFIKARLDAGDKKKTIAKKLGKDGAIITQHLALIDAPSCIEDAYGQGKCTSPKTLYALRGLYEKFPEQVEAWCVTVDDITRKLVAELSDALNDKKPPSPDSRMAGAKVVEFGHDQILGSEMLSSRDIAKNDNNKKKTWPKDRVSSDSERLSKPLLLVEVEGRTASVFLNRKPSKPGLIRIRFEDSSEDVEVEASTCKICALIDGRNPEFLAAHELGSVQKVGENNKAKKIHAGDFN